MTCLSANMYQQISKFTDKFPNVPTKLHKSIIGGGGQLPPPPAPPGYDSVCVCVCVDQDGSRGESWQQLLLTINNSLGDVIQNFTAIKSETNYTDEK